jgi:site-specific DNA-methyltransferase (adenine-specific)
MKSEIFKLDCIKGIKKLKDNSINLIIVDPPYNLNKDFGVYKEKKNTKFWKNITFDWLKECHRVLSDKGNIFVYGIHKHICWVQCMMFEIGFHYRRQIIWHYENGFAGYGKRTLNAEYEPLLWFSKSNNYIYHPIRVPYKSVERLKYKITKNNKVWTPNPDGKMEGDIWKFPTLAGRRFKDEKVNHPTQKPLSISRRIVRHFSNKNDFILIPFCGSGSECVASIIEGRRFVSFELNSTYIKIAKQRLKNL